MILILIEVSFSVQLNYLIAYISPVNEYKDNDNLFSVDYMKELYDRLNVKNKELAIIKDASHLIFQENIKESLDNIVPWLEKIL